MHLTHIYLSGSHAEALSKSPLLNSESLFAHRIHSPEMLDIDSILPFLDCLDDSILVILSYGVKSLKTLQGTILNTDLPTVLSSEITVHENASLDNREVMLIADGQVCTMFYEMPRGIEGR